MLASYDHPKGLLGELVGQLADAFWWIKVYRRDKDNLIVSHMASTLVKRRSYVEQDQQLWLSTFEALSEFFGGAQPDLQARKDLNKLMTEKGHNIASLRARGDPRRAPPNRYPR